MELYVRIKKKLGNFQLDVEFTVKDGILGMLGASGCGKSMTLKCIAGIEKPDEGRITLNGRELFDSEKGINLPPQKRRVGYLFQSYALFPNMTVEENIAAGIHKSKKEKAEKTKEIIRALRLSGMEKKRPPQLSGGQQQRVALARLLASEPDIIMLDEPFSALDSHLKWKLEQEVMDILSDFPGCALLVSHNRDEIYRLCDKVAIISGGRLDALADQQAIFARPETLESAILTGCKNFSHARRLSEHSLYAQDWGLALRSSLPVPEDIDFVGIRAHYLRLLPPQAKEEQNVLSCRLQKVIDNPFSVIIMVNGEESANDSEYAALRCEMEKHCWQTHGSPQPRIYFPPESLLFLRENSLRK